MSRHRRPRFNLRKSWESHQTTIYAAAGSLATAGVAAGVIVAGPSLFGTAATAGQPSGAPALALDVGRGIGPAGRQAAAATQAAGQPVNPALVARQAMAAQYARVQADRKAAARRAAERAASLAAAQRRQAAAHHRAAAHAAPSGTPQQIAMAMLPSFGWSSSQFSCLNSLWERESGWNPYASNPSGAYGIPQALPGSKMASAGADWQSNPATQIRWGLGYIRSTYGSPCAAWSHETTDGWY